MSCRRLTRFRLCDVAKPLKGQGRNIEQRVLLQMTSLTKGTSQSPILKSLPSRMMNEQKLTSTNTSGATVRFVTRDMYPTDLPGGQELAAQPSIICRGGSTIVGPLGELLAGPVYDREELLVAEIDMSQIVQGRLDFDVVGHYARPDVFRLKVDETPRSAVRLDTSEH